MKDDERSGRPTTSRTDDNIVAVYKMVKEDRNATSRLIADTLGIPKTVVLRILREDLKIRNLCSRFVPHALTREQMDERADLLVRVSECQSSECVGEHSPRPKNLGFQKPKVKTKLIVFFDSQGIVDKEFVQEGCTVNTEYYKGVLDHLISRIRRVRPALYRTRDFFLLHDNAPAHSAAKFRQFLTQKQVATMNHPPYSPGLSPLDYFLFPKV